MIRNPHGIISSLKKAALRHGKDISKNLWIDYLFDFYERYNAIKEEKNVTTILYEELCHNSEKEVKRICNFLNINFDKKILKYNQEKGHIFMANRMKNGDGNKIVEDRSWECNLSEQEKNIIQKSGIMEKYDTIKNIYEL